MNAWKWLALYLGLVAGSTWLVHWLMRRGDRKHAERLRLYEQMREQQRASVQRRQMPRGDYDANRDGPAVNAVLGRRFRSPDDQT
jgi:hypothetical protein